MLSGLAPDSMIDETNAANSGGDQPCSGDSSVWMKSSPYSGWSLFSMRPYMWTPQPVHAWRWIVALESTTFSLSALAVTLRLSRGTTATCENSAPPGFQHFVQPHTWLCARLTFDRYGDLVVRTLAVQRPAGEVGSRGLDATVDRRMNGTVPLSISSCRDRPPTLSALRTAGRLAADTDKPSCVCLGSVTARHTHAHALLPARNPST